MSARVYIGSPSRSDIYVGTRPFALTPDLLFTFAFVHGWTEHMEDAHRDGCRLMLDSGAFSVARGKDVITVEDHTRFVETHGDRFEWCAALDVIGNPEETWRNYEWQRTRVPVVPTLHCGAPMSLLDAFLATRPHMLALGGLAGDHATQEQKQAFCRAAFDKLCDDAGRPVLPVHGFGMATGPLFVGFPWTTTDSALPIRAAERRAILIRHGAQCFNIYLRGNDLQREDRRSVPLDGPEGVVILQRLESHGYTLDDVRDESAFRIAFNIHEVLSGAPLVSDTFTRSQPALF